MAGPLYYDRVKETTTTSGTGTYSLGGAVTGFQAFSTVGDGNTCYYAITDGTNWEVGLGTYTLSGTTLARTSILASSNSGSAVSWSAGSKTIWLDVPAYTIATTATASTLAARDGNANVAANSFLPNGASTPTAAGTTTLTVGSAMEQHFTGSSTQTVVLPVVSTTALYQPFWIYNDSTGGRLTVNSSGGNLVQTMGVGTWAKFTVISTSGTGASSWAVQYFQPTSDWVSYSPTFTAFGTVVTQFFESRRVGDTLQIRGKWTTATPTATEARITMGFNGTNNNVTSDSVKVPAIQLAGPAVTSVVTAASFYALVESNVGYLTFGLQSASAAALTKQNGSTWSASSAVQSIMVEVPIANW